MTIMIVISWILTAMSIAGVILNIKKLRSCFYIWSVTNLGWMIIDFYYGLYAQAALFGIYLVLAIIGIVKWR